MKSTIATLSFVASLAVAAIVWAAGASNPVHWLAVAAGLTAGGLLVDRIPEKPF